MFIIWKLLFRIMNKKTGLDPQVASDNPAVEAGAGSNVVSHDLPQKLSEPRRGDTIGRTSEHQIVRTLVRKLVLPNVSTSVSSS